MFVSEKPPLRRLFAFPVSKTPVVSYVHMQLPRTTWAWVGSLLVIGIVIGGWFWYRSIQVPAFPVNAKDTISSWTFQGAYTGNETLLQKADANIQKLRGFLGKEGYDDYDLYIGIGNEYALIGDGVRAYENYNSAAAIGANRALAYANMANLMERMGAFETAADAYAESIAREPGILQYHIGRLNYLTRQFRQDSDRVMAAVTRAREQFGDIPQILSIQAEWLTGLERYADAVTVWQQVKSLVEGDTSSIDAEIARLRAKQ